MMKIVPFEGFDFNHYGSYQPLLDYLKNIDGYTQHRLKDSAGGLEIWGFSLGDFKKPTIFIDGQIHSNHEWNTSHFAGEFMKILNNPDDVHKGIIHYLKSKYSFYFIPCVNPDGYNRGIHQGSENDNGVHLNLNFDWNWDNYDGSNYKGEYPFSEPEAQNIRDIINELLPVAYVNLHCWGGGEGVYVRLPQNETYTTLFNDYINSIRLTLPHMKINRSSKNQNASSYNWAGDITSSAGRKIISTVLETGNQGLSYEKIEQSSNTLNGLLLFFLHADHLLTSSQLTINNFTS